MYLRTVLFSMVAFSILGCSVEESKPGIEEPKYEKPEYKKPAEPIVEPPVKSTLKPFVPSEVKSKIIPLADPNTYAIEVSWPKTDMAVFIRRNTDDGFAKIEQGKDAHRFIVAGGTTTNIEIESRESESGPAIDHVKIEVNTPRDLVFDKVTSFNQNEKINCGRLFMRAQSVLQLKNFDIELNCDELISDSGIIETFPKGTTAPGRGASGRSGGKSKFSFRKASGILNVHLIGENGSYGRNGVSGDHRLSYGGCRGQNGGNGGGSGDVTILLKESSPIKIHGSVIPGTGGAPGQMIAAFGDKEAIHLSMYSGFPYYEPCILGGGTGTPGSRGRVGKLCMEVESQPSSCSAVDDSGSPV